MTTALQQQLAAIAASSTHQLDLKAQKTAHGKSLLFEPKVAANQSFDSIFQICQEGYQELCMLDPRFTPFARSLFSEQSKGEDRTQMTAKENEALDKVVESFLGLVGARLLLRPAAKALEWLVRRFRVHEYNTEFLILTFLPYHAAQIFSTLLSILPKKLSPAFKFLFPYINALQNPPRRTIVYTATHTPTFFSAFNQYILKISSARHHSANILAFWASVSVQAIDGMLDSARSGRASIQTRREEDVFLAVLPLLNDALAIRKIPELHIACYMILTLLATKADMEDKILDTLMEAVVNSWSEDTLYHGLVCLAVVAQEKQVATLPRAAIKAMLKLEGLVDRLLLLAEQHDVERLVFGVALGALETSGATQARIALDVIEQILEAQILDEQQMLIVIESMLLEAERYCHETHDQLETPSKLGDVIVRMFESPRIGNLTREVVKKRNLNVEELEMKLKTVVRSVQEPVADTDGDVEMLESPQPTEEPSFENVLSAIPTRMADETSFLGSVRLELVEDLARAFLTALPKKEYLERYTALPILAKDQTYSQPTFFSFFSRIWCGDYPTLARITALNVVAKALSGLNKDPLDLQALVPYIVAALGDEAISVRRAAAELAVVVHGCYRADAKDSKVAKDTKTWAHSDLYGQSTKDLSWLSGTEAYKLCALLTPSLEECVLDANQIGRFIELALNGSSQAQNRGQHSSAMDIKTSIRTSIFTFLSSHIAHTPLLTVRYRLLSMLNQNGKVGTAARHTVLLPAIQQWASLPANEVARVCATEKIEVFKLDQAYLGAITARDQPGLVYLVLPDALTTQEQPSAAKRRRTSKAEMVKFNTKNTEELSSSIRKITIALELVEASKPEKHPELLGALFHLLGELQQYRLQTKSSLVYLQGLVLGSLSSIVNELKHAGAHKIDRSVIRADLIVDCVRSTPNPQIHNSALLLISGLASYAPDFVLHSVMPIFTFTGNTLLRQSDEYSAHVIDQTITRVVPPLVESLRRKNQDVVAGAAELLLSFTTSFEHIPPHRRLRLFSHLVTTLGPEESLFAVMAMLVERYYSTEIPVGSPVGHFIADLMALFEPHTNLTAASKFVDVITDSLQPKRSLSEKILSLNESSPTHIETTAVNLLETLSELLKNPQFSRKLATALQQDEATATSLRATFCDLWGKIIRLSHDTVGRDQLHFVSENAISVLLELLPTADFVECAVILLENRDDKLRRDILKSIETRVSLEKHGDARSRRVLLDFLPRITNIIQTTSDVPLKYTALACIDQISDKYGKKDSDAIASAARVVADVQALGSDDDPIRVMSLLCLVSAVEVLRDEFIPLLPQVLTTALHYIDLSTRKDSSNEKLHNAAYALVGSVLEHIPYMFSGKYLDTILRLSHKSANAGLSEEANDNRAHFYQFAAKQLDAKECFAALERNWDGATKQGHSGLREHLDMLNTALTRHPKSVVIRNSQTLFRLFIRAFDLRHACAVDSLSDVYDDEQMENLEALINEIAISMTLKLNDTAFRPFFSIVTSYSSYMLAHAVHILQNTSFDVTEGQTLLRAVLGALARSFQYDEDDFWQSPAHFSPVSAPLLELLTHTPTLPAPFITTHVVPTIVALATAGGSAHHKSLNTTLLSYMRSASPATRLAAVKTEIALTENLGEEWLVLLPEMLPIISEGREDGDEDVERAVDVWVKGMETILGEDLEDMLL
ncbi:hypothetical protein B0A49_00828 [Cryomyces minteri]|uniref:U3 small nucleolar RNA-associated protein 10 n=1 Tax=Cryomyces minteri TaxID=331657 RepID=A0A4U0XVT8_9PEZI|nr:hypothetical protein B0A49_00828 [Cryomyces minteri]